MAQRLSEVRHGRNWIRQGDLIRVRPSRSGRHDGFVAKFRYAEETSYAVIELDHHGAFQKFRFVRPEMVRRIAKGGKA